MTRALQLGLVLLSLSSATAIDMSSMYDTATLEQWDPRYRASTNRILTEYVFKYLAAAEKRRLAGISIDFPLMAERQERGNPLAFYAPSGESRVVFPIFSLKFLDDLCIAYAWLQKNGYVLDTVSEYTAMLVHKDFAGRYPAPLHALQIPNNALNNKSVDDLAISHFVTARMFILLHELGHVYYGHTGGSSIPNEVQADRFAIDVMARSPVPPLGAMVFFMADASMAGYPPQARTHPLSGARLQAMAASLQNPEMAQQMRALAALLDDPETRAGGILAAKATTLAGLAPRRTHMPDLPKAAQSATIAFHGRCSGKVIQQIDPGNSITLEMVLNRTGNRVTGQYTIGLGIGTIEGTVAGSTLHLEWRSGNVDGRGVLTTADDGAHLSGNWGYRQSNQGGGTWSCTRQ